MTKDLLFNTVRCKTEWNGETLTLETGRMARQADGAVLVTCGETSILCTAVGAKKAKPDIDFFPLTVHYQERLYAAGRIPGGYIKREGKPSEVDVLTSRLIDRPIRPLFPQNFRNEVQVICMVISHSSDNDPTVLAMIGASAALSISGIPFLGPLAAARVGYIDDEYVLNPTPEQLETSKLDLMVAGTKSGVLMVESEAQQLSEEIMLGAVNYGHEAFQPVLQLIEQLKEKAGKKAWELEDLSAERQEIKAQVAGGIEADLRKAYNFSEKQERAEAILSVKEKAKELFSEQIDNEKMLSAAFKGVEADVLRQGILKDQKRVDGRRLDEVRPIKVEVGILPRTHGSALFTRGETQALVVTTLGTSQDEQGMDSLAGDYREAFMLHYNFPPYSVGEAGRMGPPGRREIGHGKLAQRALRALIPTKEEFPYTIRTVSEITESNGSSSMATVCGTSLSLMDAGVPLACPIAGIAMGLIKEGDDYAVLTDILGDEDHLGDMDFKVAGTQEGVTALQMDIKITGITPEIMQVALKQARDGRLHILEEMSKGLDTSRDDVSERAPRIVSLQIPQDKIRDIIGPGGKMIREICETTSTKIDIDDTGKVSIAGMDQESIDAAVATVKGIACDPEIGELYTGKVARVVDFGAFVTIVGGKDGLVHISELTDTRVDKVTDIVNVGDEVQVKVIGLDRGRIRLSMKDVTA